MNEYIPLHKYVVYAVIALLLGDITQEFNLYVAWVFYLGSATFFSILLYQDVKSWLAKRSRK